MEHIPEHESRPQSYLPPRCWWVAFGVTWLLLLLVLVSPSVSGRRDAVLQEPWMVRCNIVKNSSQLDEGRVTYLLGPADEVYDSGSAPVPDGSISKDTNRILGYLGRIDPLGKKYVNTYVFIGNGGQVTGYYSAETTDVLTSVSNQ